MTSRPTTLIICRESSQLHLLQARQGDVQRRFVLATDDPDVRGRVEALRIPIDELCWLEQMESTFKVGKEVLAITDFVNVWAGRRAGHSPATRHLLTWLKSVEPGEPAGLIQDTLLLVRSYLHLIETHRPETILLLTSAAGTLWEDAVLLAVARARNVTVKRLMPLSAGGGSMVNTIRRAARSVGRAPRSIADTVLHLVKLRRAEVRANIPSWTSANGSRLIAFQLASPLQSQVENVREAMTAVSRRGYRTVALTCFSVEAAVEASRCGLEAIELARFLSVGVILRGALRALATCGCIAFHKREFTGSRHLQYCGVPLGELLWPIVVRRFAGHLVWRTAMTGALTQFMTLYRPMAMKLWGGVNLPEGFLAWQAAVQQGGTPPLLFNYEIGSVFPDWPYQPHATPYLLLVPGQVQVRALGQTVPPDQIVPVGSARYRAVAEWSKHADPTASRKTLKIPTGFDLHVLFDSNTIWRGLLSAREQTVVARALLDFAANQPNCALIIKPHPTHTIGAIDQMIAERNSHNVFLAPHDALPYAAINAVDLVITKVSTIIIEAMLLKRPVISVALDNEPRWTAAYGSAIERLSDVDSVAALLERLVRDAAWRAAWIERRRRAQDEFLKAYFDYSCDISSDVLARVLDQRLAMQERRGERQSLPASA